MSANHKISAKGVYASDEMQVGGNNVAIANQNLLINGDFRVNQREFSSATTKTYTVDRWLLTVSSGATGCTCTLNEDGTITIDNTSGTD